MMAADDVRLEPAGPDTQGLLANLLELYSHDLSDIFQVRLGSDGRFGYARLPLYWSSPDTRFPFLFRCGGAVAGFALVTRGSPATDDPSDLDVAEFFVLRAYRRNGIGRQAAAALWTGFPGHWVVRVSEANRAALVFWESVVREYTGGQFSESTRSSDGHVWRVFAFDSRSPAPA